MSCALLSNTYDMYKDPPAPHVRIPLPLRTTCRTYRTSARGKPYRRQGRHCCPHKQASCGSSHLPPPASTSETRNCTLSAATAGAIFRAATAVVAAPAALAAAPATSSNAISAGGALWRVAVRRWAEGVVPGGVATAAKPWTHHIWCCAGREEKGGV